MKHIVEHSKPHKPVLGLQRLHLQVGTTVNPQELPLGKHLPRAREVNLDWPGLDGSKAVAVASLPACSWTLSISSGLPMKMPATPLAHPAKKSADI